MTTPASLQPIGVVHSCFREKFGIPRQSGLVEEARGWIEFHPPWDDPRAFAGLEGCSHLWVQFLFHQAAGSEPRLQVRPPRLGGNRSLGVFATRSPFRPNALGLSVVRLEAVITENNRTHLQISGLDMVEGTPVLDIKPYLPYADSIPQARFPWAGEPPASALEVHFSPSCQEQLQHYENTGYPGLGRLLRSLLSLDPRPAYRQGTNDDRQYGMRLYDLDVQWRVTGRTGVEVTRIQSDTESDGRELL